MYPYSQSGQRINSIAQQYMPYQNLIRQPTQNISISPNRAPMPHYNNPVYYSNPYSNILNPRR
jgi:hypothetical protein